MKKRLLQLGAVILCIMMCLCGTVSVFAEMLPLEDKDSANAVIRVTVGQEGETVPDGMRATAFRIITVNVVDGMAGGEGGPAWQPAEPVYSWAKGVRDWVNASEYSAYVDVDNNYAVTDAYRNATDEDIAAFIDALAAAIKHGDTGFKKGEDNLFEDSNDPLVKSAVFEGGATTSIEGLSKGSYIVLIENGNKIYKPSVVNFTPKWLSEVEKPGWYIETPAAVEIKAAEVSLDKTVSNSEAGPFASAVNAGISDTVYYNITAPVPAYPEKALDKAFVIEDILPTGLSLQDVPKVYGDSVDLATVTGAYTYTTAANGFTITFDYSKIASYENVTVKYSATLNRNAVLGSAGNINTAKLTYTNNPYIENGRKTINDSATVYTYGLQLTKTNNVNGENAELLPGAVFRVQRNVNGTWQTVHFVDEGNNVYRRALSAGGAGTLIDLVTSGAEGAMKGRLNLRGLGVGQYQLVEVEAPAGGYVLPKEPIPFTIKDDVDSEGNGNMDGILDDGKVNSGVKTGYLALTVKNSKGFDLPLTGGMGTILFTAGGIVLVAGAVVLLLVANKKKSRRS